VPAGERPSLLTEFGEQADRFLDGCRTVIGERPRYHGILPGGVVERAGDARELAGRRLF
jgi:hypothetical protein